MKQRTLSFLGKAFLAGLLAVLVSTQVQAAGPWAFRNGEAGYTGAVDTQIRQAGVQAPAPATDDSALNPINADNQDGTTPGVVNALIRFNDIIGTGPGQIPPGTTIANATLVLRSTAANANSPGPVRAHRMVQDWPTTVTFANSFNGDGIQADDVEANISQDGADIIPNFTNPAGNPLNTAERTVDVTATVQAWINGSVPNYGWVLINASNDGYRIDSSETAIITNRPTLKVVESILPPNITDQPDSATVLQCRTATFSVAAEGVPPLQYQWLYEVTPGNYQLVDQVLYPSAATPTLVITNVQPSHAGNYKVEVINQAGTTPSDVATLTVTPDGTGPVAVRAVVSADRTTITISYDEPVLASDGLGNDNAQDPFDYQIREVGNPGNFLSVQQSPLPALVNETNIVLTIDPTGPQWAEGTRYEVEIAADIPDTCNQTRSAGQIIAVQAPFVLREGLRGYAGTRDVELNSASAGTAIDVDPLVCDTDPQTQQFLLQFSDLFGGDPLLQIPDGSTITRATLQLNQTDPGSPINVYRMLQPFTEASTWNDFVNGVTNDDVEARAALSFNIPNAGNGLRTFDVTADVAFWSANGGNFGWAFIPSGGDGHRYNSSETATEASRPTLTVEFIAAPPTCVGFRQQPPPNITIDEGQTLTISCVVTGTSPMVQWSRNGSPIGGATMQTYTKVNANPTADNGTYRLTADNNVCDPPRVSDPCNVTVNPDLIRPTLVQAVADADMTTIRLTYSEIMGPSAGAIGSYSIPGLSITSATLQPDGSNVVLVTSARTFRQSYTLTITGVRDDAVTAGGNLLNPNPTVVTIRSDEQRIVGFHDQWYWNTNCQDFTGWETVGFDPAANLWPQGPGTFGLETGGTLTDLANLGAQIQTPWVAPSANFLAAYLRRAVTIPAGLNLSGGAQIIIRYLRDDGMLLYVDGTETIRTSNMTNNPTYCTNMALNAAAVNITEGEPETTVLAMTAGQTYQVAVQIQQNSATSSDVLFGAEILAVFPQPRLTIAYDGGANTVTVSWAPAGGTQLEESTDLVNWSNSTRLNGVAFTNPGGLRFYRVRR